MKENINEIEMNENNKNESNMNTVTCIDFYYASIDNQLAYSLRNVISDNPLLDLHKAWGHVSEKYIKRALHENMVTGCKYSYDDIKDCTLEVCLDCMKGRMKAELAGKLSDTK